MTSDEKRVAEVARDLLAVIVQPDVQLALDIDAEELKLPAMVVSARFDSEEEGSPLPKKYKLTVEFRSIFRPDDAKAVDSIFGQVRETLCPDASGGFTNPPVSMTGKFDFFSIEKQDGSGHERANDVITRSRSFDVFARLL